MEKEISHSQFKNPSCVWNLSLDQQKCDDDQQN
jgi:hypothetical protein